MLETIVKEGIVIPIGNHTGKTIVLASDHRGFGLKQLLLKYVTELHFTSIDVGTCSEERCDYPDYAALLGKYISEHPFDHVGIAICRSGNGVGIVTGKFTGVYAVHCHTSHPDAFFARKHNNSNVLLLGALGLSGEAAKSIVNVWLRTPFYGGPQDEVYLNRYVKTVKIEKEIMAKSL